MALRGKVCFSLDMIEIKFLSGFGRSPVPGGLVGMATPNC